MTDKEAYLYWYEKYKKFDNNKLWRMYVKRTSVKPKKSSTSDNKKRMHIQKSALIKLLKERGEL